MIKTRFSFLYSIAISCAMLSSTFAMEFIEKATNSAGLTIIDVQDPKANEQFVQSLRQKGFALIKNPSPDIDIMGLKEEWAGFFAKSPAEKKEFSRDLSPIGLGYYPLGVERAEGATEQNFMEYYHYATGHALPKGLNDKTESYFSAMREVKIMLTRWIDQVHAAEGFVLPERIRNGGVNTQGLEITGINSVEEMAELDLHSNIVRIIHYPPVCEEIGKVVNVAHTDISALSLLFATQPGLQLLGKDGRWYDVGGDPDVLVVNAGDMLSWGTDGYLPENCEKGIKSTVHRVIRANNKPRFAFAAFFGVKPWLQILPHETAKQAFDKRVNGNLSKANAQLASGRIDSDASDMPAAAAVGDNLTAILAQTQAASNDSDVINTTTDDIEKNDLKEAGNTTISTVPDAEDMV